MTYEGPWDAEFIESQYERWKADPDSVEKDWQAFFRGFELGRSDAPEKDDLSRTDADAALKQSRVEALIYRYRDIGHLLSCLDPLAACPTSHPFLEPGAFGLGSEDMGRTFYFRGLPEKERSMTLADIIGRLRQTYCGDVGVEYMHLQDPEERGWLMARLEAGQGRHATGPDEKVRILRKLCESTAFEQFIHRKYLGQKRFSGEGADAMVPMVDALVSHAGDVHGCGRIIMGMAHRGRLNMQVNVLGKPYSDILREFENRHDPGMVVGGGDVKYHSGFDGEVSTRGGKRVHVVMAHNPSHLESVNPVICGMARAYQEQDGKHHTVPLILHGDAAFAGQGVVAETLNMSQLEGYGTGGTIHLVINNQIGYTALPDDLRSTRYATDMAKMLMVPIFHVHGENPEAAVAVIKLAVDYRTAFLKDVVIDLVCYRRYGHNEGDEPYFTQPLMYERIKNRPPLSDIYFNQLKEEGVVDEKGFEEINGGVAACLKAAHDRAVKESEPEKEKTGAAPGLQTQKQKPLKTSVSASRLKSLAKKINRVPDGFSLHRKLERLLTNRRDAVEKGAGIDWANAEALAFASILEDGVPIRLSGQDSQRGTFSQRHSAVFDMKTSEPHVPLNTLGEEQALYYAINSLLSEAGVLGFEYGYSLIRKDGLTIWEAQFGDFANNAQSVIDLYIAAGETRWGRRSGLVLFLPHGYEGQGPDHSSARIERFLQLAAEENMRICIPTTPAQYFHLLRRQAGDSNLKPLVVMTPKSLLRRPEAVSGTGELSRGTFREVIDDPAGVKNPEKVILVAGKLYYELEQARSEEGGDHTALVRVEQLYPFPEKALSEIVHRYKKAARWVWAQEEPENMGAWRFVAPLFRSLFNLELEYVGRKASASTATGYHSVFTDEQKALLRQAMAE